MTAIAIDPRLVDWRGVDGLRYRCRIGRGGKLVFRARVRSLRDIVVWASGKSNYLKSKIQNQFWQATSFSFPATLYWAGWTATLDATSTGATAGESAYTGYARVATTANGTNYSTSSGGSATSNLTAITWPASGGGGTSTWTYIAVLDSATIGAGNVLYWGSITSAAIATGVTPQIDVSGLTATEA